MRLFISYLITFDKDVKFISVNMKKSILLLFVGLTAFTVSAQDVFLDQAIAEIGTQLQSSQRAVRTLKLAVMHFRTADNRLTDINQYIQDELQQQFKPMNRFSLIDPLGVNIRCKAAGWNLDMRDNIHVYQVISESLFKEFNEVPDGFLYGVINDNDNYLTLTAYLVPNTGNLSKYYSTIKFMADEQSDKLLGKPVTHIRKRAEVPVIKKDTVVVYKEKVVENRIVDTVYVEKKGAVAPKIETAPSNVSSKTVRVGDITLEMKNVEVVGQDLIFTFMVTNTKMDDNVGWVSSRFFDDNGNEYNRGENTMGHVNLIENIPAKVTFTFGDNAYKVKSIKVLEIVVNQTGNVQIKDIIVQ